MWRRRALPGIVLSWALRISVSGSGSGKTLPWMILSGSRLRAISGGSITFDKLGFAERWRKPAFRRSTVHPE